ncbi:MAG: serine--tRNA ligase, partial [Bacteroidetes bacterium]|nr:serine--tRNA ligase [Bacteroidota bacterium]
MIPLQQLRNAKDEIILRLAKRGKDYRLEIEQIIKLDEDRRQCQKVLDELLAKANIISKEIALAFKEGNKNKAESLKQESLSMKANIVDAENRHKELSAEIQNALYELPNAPHISVPFGKSAEENEEVYSWGNIPNLPESALPHWDLVSKYDLIDFELGNKIAGAGFPVYKGKGARLQRALINFFLDKALQAGYL